MSKEREVRDENKELKTSNLDYIREINGLKFKMEELNDENKDLYKELKNNKIDHITLLTYLVKGANSNDQKKAQTFIRIATDLNDKRVIKDSEYKVVLNPPKIINEGEVLQALKHINEENEKAAEEFYKMNNNNYNIN